MRIRKCHTIEERECQMVYVIDPAAIDISKEKGSTETNYTIAKRKMTTRGQTGV